MVRKAVGQAVVENSIIPGAEPDTVAVRIVRSRTCIDNKLDEANNV